jgi:acyl carrier protein
MLGMQVNTVDIENKLIDYFKEKVDTVVDSDTLLLEEKVIDSMGVIELVTFLEATYGVEFTDDDLTVDNFKTIGSISDLIVSKPRISPP